MSLETQPASAADQSDGDSNDGDRLFNEDATNGQGQGIGGKAGKINSIALALMDSIYS